MKKVLGNWIVSNLLKAFCFVAGVVLLVSVLLNVLTNHNQEIVVPDFNNLTVEEASAKAASLGIRVEVSDSVFIRQMRRGAVFNQMPKAGSKVKKGRRILLSTNSRVSKKVLMPGLVGFSLHQAKAELLSKGLTIDKLVYSKDIATNYVLRQEYKGVEIEPETRLESGSPITLVLGRSEDEGYTYIPNLVGKKFAKSRDDIWDHSLNVGKMSFDLSVKSYGDSLNAVVVSQNPVSGQKEYLMGTSIDLVFSNDPEVIASATAQNVQ